MLTPNPRKILRRKPVLAVLLAFAPIAMHPAPSFAAEPGTIGLAVNQLYSEQQPAKRGSFMVRRVEPSSAAEDAGIKAGDLIVATDGKPVAGIDAREMNNVRLAGPAGSSLQLSVVQADGNLKKMTLVRKPYPPHLNPASDAFRYVVPGNWEMDPRYPFPLPWSPSMSYTGFEDLFFAPGFDDLESTEYHSYLFVWWLDGKPVISAAKLQADMVTYFRGLAEQRGRNNNFKPDPLRVTAEYRDVPTGPAQWGGRPASHFSGLVTIYDRHGSVLTLHSEVTSAQCNTDHTAVFFAMSKEPRPASLWTALDAVHNQFQCRQ